MQSDGEGVEAARGRSRGNDGRDRQVRSDMNYSRLQWRDRVSFKSTRGSNNVGREVMVSG